MKVQTSALQVFQLIRLGIVNGNYEATIKLLDDVITELEQREKQESAETEK